MDPAETIRQSMGRVSELRAMASADPALGASLSLVKRLQERRFRATYRDLLQSAVFQAAAQFFLVELYGAQDFSRRDAQFARIAGTLTTLFPESVVDTAVLLAQLHGTTEELDMRMAQVWAQSTGQAQSEEERYVLAWRKVGCRSDREFQLQSVMTIGQSLVRLTRTPALRMMLKLMRTPAEKAGLAELQQFLESGFATFASLQKVRGAADQFLNTIEERETNLMQALFGPSDGVAVARQLRGAD